MAKNCPTVNKSNKKSTQGFEISPKWLEITACGHTAVMSSNNKDGFFRCCPQNYFIRIIQNYQRRSRNRIFSSSFLFNKLEKKFSTAIKRLKSWPLCSLSVGQDKNLSGIFNWTNQSVPNRHLSFSFFSSSYAQPIVQQTKRFFPPYQSPTTEDFCLLSLPS